MTEQWRPIVGREGQYEVSDHGRVRSLDHYVPCRGNGLRLAPGRLLRQTTDTLGRRYVALGRGVKMRVAPLVLSTFVEPCPDGMECCHNDGDPGNNSVGNLRWDTHSGNMYDRARHGTDPKRNRTHCPMGHRLAEPNLLAWAQREGYRGCLSCARARAAQQRARGRGESFDLKAGADARYAELMGS
jgi:hypothetical protein